MVYTKPGRSWSWIPLLLALACNGEGDDDSTTTVATLAPTTVGSTSSNGSGSDSDPTGSTSADTTGDDADTTVGVDSSDDGGPPPLPTCGHQCATAADCSVGGNDLGFECLSGLCGVACTDDNYCVVASSGWLAIPCTGDGDCNGGACVDIGDGTGGCSFTPAQGNCADAGLSQMQWMALGGGMIDVCGRPFARCGDFDGTMACFNGCEPGGCGEMVCGDDGRCQCDFDTQCVDQGLGNNCNAQGQCELACQQPADCPESGFDGGMVVCE